MGIIQLIDGRCFTRVGWLLTFALSPSILSTVVVQPYDIDIGKEFVIVGNDAIVKCQVPSFVADWVSIIGWTASDDELKSMTQENSQGNQLEGS